MQNRISNPFALALLVATLCATTAQAHQQTWTIEGTITQTLDSLDGFEVGDPYTFTLVFETLSAGTQFAQFTEYNTGVATFTSVESAMDLEARILIQDAPNSISISLQPPDATLFQLEEANFPGEFRTPTRISVFLGLGGAGSENLRDYLQLPLPTDPADRRLDIVFVGGGILGSVDSIESASEVPTGAFPWLLFLLPGLVLMTLRSRESVPAQLTG